jgi:hypothetical protein
LRYPPEDNDFTIWTCNAFFSCFLVQLMWTQPELERWGRWHMVEIAWATGHYSLGLLLLLLCLLKVFAISACVPFVTPCHLQSFSSLHNDTWCSSSRNNTLQKHWNRINCAQLVQGHLNSQLCRKKTWNPKRSWPAFFRTVWLGCDTNFS